MNLLHAWGSSTVTMSGGNVLDLAAGQSSVIGLSGGTVGGDLSALNSAALVIKGTNFAVDGSPVPYGRLAALSGRLTGTLNSGDSLNNLFSRDSCAGIVLIPLPEPSHAVLLGFGLLGLLALARRGPAWRGRPRG